MNDYFSDMVLGVECMVYGVECRGKEMQQSCYSYI